MFIHSILINILHAVMDFLLLYLKCYLLLIFRMVQNVDLHMVKFVPNLDKVDC